ncbi:MAG: hypothetical protein ACI85O_002687 [Saprospiraceae bacterium]|jgi:hypothetical protein
MKKYLKYLLADIETAKKNRPPIPKLSDDVSQMFRGPDEYLSPPLQNMSEWFGLDARAFPPAERWSEEDLTIIIDAMTKLWHVYNYDAAFPDGMGKILKYELFVKVLSEPVPWVSSGFITIDFCESNIDSCALGEFCACREMVDIMDDLPHKDEIIIAEPSREVNVSASMQRYYEQLLSDLNEALQNLPDYDDYDFEDDFDAEEEEEEEFEHLDEKIYEEESENKPLPEWLNVPKTVFPSLEQLSTEMVIEVVRAIEKLWWHAGYVPYFPKGLNIEMKYQLFREQWDRVVPWPSDESIYLGFCSDDEDNCIYGAEMCSCAIYKLPYDDDDDDDELGRQEKKLLGGEEEEPNLDLNLDEFLRGMGFDEGDIEEEDDSSLPF